MTNDQIPMTNKVIDKLKKKKRTLSFEFFPPKTQEQEENLYKTVSELKCFGPDFVSVTYGALGNTKGKTFFWAQKIKDEFGIEPVAHLTCIAATRNGIKQQLQELKNMKVMNLLALRGDPPIDDKTFVPPKDGFKHATDLIRYIKSTGREFCIGAAGNPEGHCETKDYDRYILHIKEKVEAGAEYIITQLFFDNSYYYNFVEKCRSKGISVPIVPGIMPIINAKQIKRMTGLCGATIPKNLLEKIEKHQNDNASIMQIGIEQSALQCRDLVQKGVPGVHFFVLNQSASISKILKEAPIKD